MNQWTATDEPWVAPLFTASLQDDPGFLWMFPQPERRPVQVRWVQGFLIRSKSKMLVGDCVERKAAALWLPPGTSPIVPLWTEIFAGLAMAPFACGWEGTLRGLRADAAVKIRLQRVQQPCWYLDTLAVSPDHQGQGLGHAMLEHGFARAGDLPIFLYTVKSDNVPYYQRFGFEVIDDAPLLADGPPAWTMRWQKRGKAAYLPPPLNRYIAP